MITPFQICFVALIWLGMGITPFNMQAGVSFVLVGITGVLGHMICEAVYCGDCSSRRVRMRRPDQRRSDDDIIIIMNPEGRVCVGWRAVYVQNSEN
jgi:hypothetical protein